MKDYSDEFKAEAVAVALHESTPGAAYESIAADLGINRNTMRNWVLRSRELRSGVPDARTAARSRRRRRPRSLTSKSGSSRPGSPSSRPVSGSWRLSGTYPARRPSISPARRTGEPLRVRPRPPGRL
ncbi:transposase [Streptomyces sp. NPDC086838]|uniref:transposase n=1 Tax=Streptomyces sp. NPDC086838 TaxID=3365762 RepID=UPI0038073954